MYQEAVMVPMGSWAKDKIKSEYESDEVRTKSPLGNAFSRKVKNWEGRELAYPSNVLSFATECGNKQHSAAFPVELPTWFIKLFSKSGDVILDPFLGSGTVAIAAKRLVSTPFRN
jgi:site-specific DNA-methyltransferase (adenine-specific)